MLISATLTPQPLKGPDLLTNGSISIAQYAPPPPLITQSPRSRSLNSRERAIVPSVVPSSPPPCPSPLPPSAPPPPPPLRRSTRGNGEWQGEGRGVKPGWRGVATKSGHQPMDRTDRVETPHPRELATNTSLSRVHASLPALYLFRPICPPVSQPGPNIRRYCVAELTSEFNPVNSTC